MAFSIMEAGVLISGASDQWPCGCHFPSLLALFLVGLTRQGPARVVEWDGPSHGRKTPSVPAISCGFGHDQVSQLKLEIHRALS